VSRHTVEKELYIGEYRETDIPDILDLFHLSFNKRISEEWFVWKYRDSPWSSKGYTAIYKGKVVAFYGGLRLPFYFRGKDLWAFQLCDVMTHQEHRGSMFSKSPFIVMLGEMLYRENSMDFAFGFPSQRHARLQSLRLGGQGYRLVRLYKKEPLKSHLKSLPLGVTEGWEFLEGEKLNTFLRKDDAILSFVKSEKYIRWRYMENPLKIYSLLVFKRLNIIKGYIIFTIDNGWFNILEIFLENVSDVGDILSSAEVHIMSTMDNVKGLKAWFHPEEPVKKYLDRYGYHYEDSIPVAFKPVNINSGVTSDIFYSQYFYRMGDYDAS
jgi:hypothetical protein